MALSSPGNRTSTWRKPLWRSGSFADHDCGLSARRIAAPLNAEGITPPRGGNNDAGFWGPSTIQGNWKSGTEILDNELYVGMLVWNRQTCLRDPDTTKRRARLSPAKARVVTEMPNLQIIDELRDHVKARQAGSATP